LKLTRFSLERSQKFVIWQIDDVACTLGALSRYSVESMRNWQQVEVVHRGITRLSLGVVRKAQQGGESAVLMVTGVSLSRSGWWVVMSS
jgi:hypothetical protein